MLAEQAWSIKDQFYGQNEIRTKRENPEREREAHFARSGSQSERI